MPFTDCLILAGAVLLGALGAVFLYGAIEFMFWLADLFG